MDGTPLVEEVTYELLLLLLKRHYAVLHSEHSYPTISTLARAALDRFIEKIVETYKPV